MNIAPENLGRPTLLPDGTLRVQLTPAAGGGATSGAWSKTFTLAESMNADVSFDYRAVLGPGFGDGQFAEIHLSNKGVVRSAA